MEPHLLVWGVITFIMVPGGKAELCDDDPPEITHATFKALAYRRGTMLNCECRRGYRRIKNGSPYILCTGNSSHSSWDNKCQCMSTTSRHTRGVTRQPEEQKERKVTDMQSQVQPVDQVSLPGHCTEPPRWEHEAARRMYLFVVGQTVHYQCVQGYRALQRGPARSVCEMTGGKTRWTRPGLTCVDETEPSPLPGEEPSQASPSDLPRRETSCPFTTTDYQERTEAAATTGTFIFTTQYQVAVAGCVLLLFTILLLSGLTLQQRWLKTSQDLIPSKDCSFSSLKNKRLQTQRTRLSESGGRVEERSRKPREQEFPAKKPRTANPQKSRSTGKINKVQHSPERHLGDLVGFGML